MSVCVIPKRVRSLFPNEMNFDFGYHSFFQTRTSSRINTRSTCYSIDVLLVKIFLPETFVWIHIDLSLTFSNLLDLPGGTTKAVHVSLLMVCSLLDVGTEQNEVFPSLPEIRVGRWRSEFWSDPCPCISTSIKDIPMSTIPFILLFSLRET